MFCSKCGKEIGDAKFCQYCGNSNDSAVNITATPILKDLFASINEKIKQIGQNKLINVISIIATVIGIIIRVTNNQIEVVYNFLAQDDYFVISENGRNYILIVIALQILISLFLYKNAKKEQTNIQKSVIILFVISLSIQILTMLLRFPAFY